MIRKPNLAAQVSPVPGARGLGLLARASILGMVLLACDPPPALAGMPMVTLTDVGRMRLQNISFFLMGLLLSAGAIQLLWNYLRRDFAFLPKIHYGVALGVVGLWGLLFVLVLTMIAGARELLTPGAWEKQGLTYRLVKDPSSSPSPPATDEKLVLLRRERLDSLRAALWRYAASHDAHFPPDRSDTEIPKDRWQLPDPSGMRYLYVPGQSPDRGETPLAYEPEIFGPQRLVLLTSGDIRSMTSEEILRVLPQEKR